MNDLQRCAHWVAGACGLICGLVVPAWIDLPEFQVMTWQQLSDFLDDRPLLAVLVFVVNVIASTLFGIVVPSVMRECSRIGRMGIKLLFIAMFGSGMGLVVSLILAYLGVIRIYPWSFFWGIQLAQGLCAGVRGIVSMKNLPEYRQL